MSGTILLSSCGGGGIPPTMVLNVPFSPQWWGGWCGAACIEMWANYQNLYTSQNVIADTVGYWPDVWALAGGGSLFTHNNGVPGIYGPSEHEQDRATSAQVSSIHNDTPSIAVVNGGSHAVLVVGVDWTYMDMQKVALGIHFHDPAQYPFMYRAANLWKHQWFTACAGQHLIVLGSGWFGSEGDMGYSEFLNQGGTYYGGPSEYYPAI